MPDEHLQHRFTVSDALHLLRVDTLRRMAKYLPVSAPFPTRKLDLVVAVERCLHGEFYRRAWNDLDGIQQLAVRQLVHGTRDVFRPTQFRFRYGTIPRGCDEFVNCAKPTLPFRFFLYSVDRHHLFLTVPDDLAEHLREFVPPLPPVDLVSEEHFPETVKRDLDRYLPGPDEPRHRHDPLERRDMEQAAARDLLAVLRLISLGQVAVSAKTRQASAAAVRTIAGNMDGGDFFGVEEWTEKLERLAGPVRAFAWPLLVQTGRLADIHGSRLALNKAGYAALGAPPAETLRRLWQRWIKSSSFDEFSRVSDIRGQGRGGSRSTMTAVSPRRTTVADGLAACPVGRWVRVDEFSRYMRAADLEFSVSNRPWRLYLEDRRYGHLGYATWDILECRYILCLLLEYAATLGMIDVGFTPPEGARRDYTHLWGSDELAFLSRYDGLEYFRLTPLGAYCLGLVEEYDPANLQHCTPLILYPDLRVCAGAPLAADERFLLETYANREGEGVWRLAHDKTLAAFESGHDADALRAFLEERDDQPMPETVDGFLRNAQRGARALSPQGAALLIECADEEIAARISSDKRLARLCLRAGAKHLAVPAKSEAAFRRAVRQIGFGMPPA